MSGLPTQIPWRRFVRVLRKLGYGAQKRKAGSGILFFSPSRNPRLVSLREAIPDKTCANECCPSTFGSFSSPQMSSCSYRKTAKWDAQTTAHDRLDRTYGNTVRPIRHSAIQINRNRNREWLRPEAHHSRISDATRQMTSKAALALARII